MVAKCANTTCNRRFRELSKGRLFLLPPTHDCSESIRQVERLSDYCFWLCPECEATHTITRGESGIVVSPRDPSLLGAAPRVVKNLKRFEKAWFPVS
jgi:hypothetical protein